MLNEKNNDQTNQRNRGKHKEKARGNVQIFYSSSQMNLFDKLDCLKTAL